MQTNKKVFSFLSLTALIFMLAGCPTLRQPVEVVLKSDSQKNDENSMSKRFQNTAPQGQTAVDSAIELAKTQTKLSEENSALRQKNQELITENSRLKERISAIEPELQQTKKELKEANDLLIEMRIELNNWKTDILGFREEMRDADKAQLETLLRILKVLGGEVKTDANEVEEENQSKGSTTESLNEQSKTGAKNTRISGDTNE